MARTSKVVYLVWVIAESVVHFWGNCQAKMLERGEMGKA